MSAIQVPTWSKYLLALVVVVVVGIILAIPGLLLPSPQDSGWNPFVGFARAIIVGAAFGLLAFTTTILFKTNRGSVHPGKRAVLFFLLFAGSDFALQLLNRPFFSWLSRHAGLQNTLARLVMADNGWLLPLMFLAAFIAVILLRRRRE